VRHVGGVRCRPAEVCWFIIHECLFHFLDLQLKVARPSPDVQQKVARGPINVLLLVAVQALASAA
jgi:hypothetical protein